MSWKPEVIADASGKWCANGLSFATREEAERSASDLAMRWLAVREWRAVESADPVSHEIVDGRMRELPEHAERILARMREERERSAEEDGPDHAKAWNDTSAE